MEYPSCSNVSRYPVRYPHPQSIPWQKGKGKFEMHFRRFSANNVYSIQSKQLNVHLDDGRKSFYKTCLAETQCVAVQKQIAGARCDTRLPHIEEPSVILSLVRRASQQ